MTHRMQLPVVTVARIGPQRFSAYFYGGFAIVTLDRDGLEWTAKVYSLDREGKLTSSEAIVRHSGDHKFITEHVVQAVYQAHSGLSVPVSIDGMTSMDTHSE